MPIKTILVLDETDTIPNNLMLRCAGPVDLANTLKDLGHPVSFNSENILNALESSAPPEWLDVVNTNPKFPTLADNTDLEMITGRLISGELQGKAGVAFLKSLPHAVLCQLPLLPVLQVTDGMLGRATNAIIEAGHDPKWRSFLKGEPCEASVVTVGDALRLLENDNKIVAYIPKRPWLPHKIGKAALIKIRTRLKKLGLPV